MFTCLIALLISSLQGAPAEPIDINWIFANEKLEWKRPAERPNQAYDEAENAQLAVFFPNGKFAQLSCTLFRDRRSGRLSICQGCGFSVRKGTWVRKSDVSLTVRSRWVYQSIQKPTPVPETEEHWTARGKSQKRFASAVQSPTERFVPLSKLANKDFLAKVISFYGEGQN